MMKAPKARFAAAVVVVVVGLLALPPVFCGSGLVSQAFRAPVRKVIPSWWRGLGTSLENFREHPLPRILRTLFPWPIEVAPAIWDRNIEPALLQVPLRPVANPAPPSSDRGLRLLTCNLFLLPPPFASSQFSRIKTFAKLARDFEADIILMQEVWFNEFAACLHGLFPEYWCIRAGEGIHNVTGLVIFSRFPPEKASVGYFPLSWESNLEEFLARKGCLAFELDLGSRSLLIVDTHLYAGKNGLEKTLTANQLVTLTDWIRWRNQPALLCGDLNLGVEKVVEICGKRFHLDSSRGATNNHLPGKGRKIDFLLTYHPTTASATISSQVISEPQVSDHKLVFGILSGLQEFSGGGKGANPGPELPIAER